MLKYFLRRVKWTVHEEFSDVQLDNLFFRVDAKFRGDRVEVCCDPFSPLEAVLIYSLEDEYLGVGTRHQRQAVHPPPLQASLPARGGRHQAADRTRRKH